MKKIFLLLNTLIYMLPVVGQINLQDSTVQVIGYWNKAEKQNYKITETSYNVKNGTDTIQRQFYSYNVDVEIIDSTEHSYTIKWLYKNFEIKETWNPVMEKLISMGNNLAVIFKTDEYGIFQEVVNWEEGRDFMKKSGEMMKSEYKNIPNFDKFIDQIVAMYSSKEALENSGIEEIQQFYTFHGAKYKLGEELNLDVKIPNNFFNGEPFDGVLTVELSQIESADDFSVLRSWQTADSKQVTDMAFEYVKMMQSTLNVPALKREDFPVATNDIRTASSIDGPSGWVIYSIQTKEVAANNLLQVNERTIELQ